MIAKPHPLDPARVIDAATFPLHELRPAGRLRPLPTPLMAEALTSTCSIVAVEARAKQVVKRGRVSPLRRKSINSRRVGARVACDAGSDSHGRLGSLVSSQ